MSERFTLHELVGTGTCSSVYRARDELLDREVAVKVFPVTDDPRVAREVSLLASLDHPALVPVYDLGEVDGHAFVVMAVFEGGNLADRLAADGPQALGEALLTAAAVADALAHVHRAGVLHRDVIPRNVLFDSDGRAHLSDFGVALVADAPRITDTGIVVGSAPYLAPEQVRGETVGPTADVYSLGLVTIEALTGRRAYEGAPLEAAQARLEHPPVLPEGLPDEVHSLLDAMTADDPAARPDAESVCRRMRRAALADEVGPDDPREDVDATGLVAPPPAGPASTGRRVGRGTMVLGAATLSIMLASGVVIAATGPVRSVAATTPPGAGLAAPTVAAPFVPGGEEQGPDSSDGEATDASSEDSQGADTSDRDTSEPDEPAASPVADSRRDTGAPADRSERSDRAPVSVAEPPSAPAPETTTTSPPATTTPETTTPSSTTPSTSTPSSITPSDTSPASPSEDENERSDRDGEGGRSDDASRSGDRGSREGGDRGSDGSDGSDRSDRSDSSDRGRSDGLLDGAVEALDRPLGGLLGG